MALPTVRLSPELDSLRATIKQFATQGPFISEIAIFRSGESEPIAIGRGSY